MESQNATFFHHHMPGVGTEPLIDHASKLRINLRSRDLLQMHPSKRGLLRKGSPQHYGNWSPLMTQVYGHMVSGHRGTGHQPLPSYIQNVVIPLHKSAEPASSYPPSLLSCSYSLSQSTVHAPRSRRGSALSCVPPSSQTHTTLDRYPSSTPRERSSVSSITATRKASPRVSRQVLRYEAEQDDLTKCRTRKRSSEIRPHRVDHMYYMTGTSLKLEPRYKVEEEELQRLRELSRARKRTTYYGRGLRNEDSYMDVGHEPPKQPPPSSTGESETSPDADVGAHDNAATKNNTKHEELNSVSDGDLTARNSSQDIPVANQLREQVESLSIQGNSAHSPSGAGQGQESNEQVHRTEQQEHNTQLEDADSGVDNNSVKDSPVPGDGDPGR